MMIKKLRDKINYLILFLFNFNTISKNIVSLHKLIDNKSSKTNKQIHLSPSLKPHSLSFDIDTFPSQNLCYNVSMYVFTKYRTLTIIFFIQSGYIKYTFHLSSAK